MAYDIKRIVVASLITFVLSIAGCGGQTQDEKSVKSPLASGSEQPEEVLVLDARQLKVVAFDAKANTSGQPQNLRVAVATGGFEYPKAGEQFIGNLTIQVEVTDTETIGQVFLTIKDSEQALILCDSNCGTSFQALVNNIQPHKIGGQFGQNSIELWVAGEEQPVQVLNIFWQTLSVSGVTGTINESTDVLTVSWSEVNEALRYNVYLATEPGHTGENFASLAGGEARLGVTGTSVTFEQKPEQQDYYVLVTGVNGTGESAFSDEIVLIGGRSVNPPTATADTFTMNEDGELNGNVIENDTAGGNTTLSINTEPLVAPTKGALTINSDGTFDYKPRLNLNGTDAFTYEITNSQGLSASAVVTINITPVNDLPVLLDNERTIEGDTFELEAPGLLSNATDVDGDELTLDVSQEEGPSFGFLELKEEGDVVYTKGDRFVTYDSFKYRVFDGKEYSNVAELILKSPDFSGFPPIANNDMYEVEEDGFLTILNTTGQGITNNDFDRDHDMSQVAIQLETDSTDGELTFNEQDGTFTYRPSENFNGQETFTYRLTDPSENSTSAIVTIVVTPANDPPNAIGEHYVITNDKAVTIAGGLGLLINDHDIEGDNLQIDLGSVTEAGSGTRTVAADGSFVYTANAGFTGTDSFTYRVSDGKASSNTATVQFTVVDVHATTDDLTPLEVQLEEVLSDLPEGAEVTGLSAQNGEVSSDGYTLVYTPPVGLDLVDSIMVEITTGSDKSTFNINVRVESDNEPPSFTSPPFFEMDEHAPSTTLVYTALASDPDEHDVTYYLDDNETRFVIDANTGELTVSDSEALDYEQASSFELVIYAQDIYTASNAFAVTVSLNNVSEGPEFTSPNQFNIVENTVNGTLIYTAEAQDPEGGEVSYDLHDPHGIFIIDSETGGLRVFDNSNLDHELHGSYTLTVMASDGELETELEVTVNISDINESPEITSSNSFEIDENTPNGSMAGYEASATDPENNNLNWSLVEDEFGIFAINSSSGALTVADNSNLDYETVSEYDIQIQATETNGSPSNLSDSLLVRVNINNIDEQTDTDGDGLSDDDEAELGTDHTDSDTDDDGLSDGDEVARGTNPLDSDSDDDERSDGAEVEAGTDPLNPDVTPASVTFVSPFNGATDICTNQTVSVTFNEQVLPDSISSSSLMLLHDGENPISGTVNIASSNTELFFAADEALSASSSFTVQVNGVRDTAGNQMTEVFTSTFTTGTCIESDRPSVVSTSPSSGATNVPQNTQLTMVIDEPIDPSTVNTGSMYLVDQFTGLHVPGMRLVSDNKMVITFVTDMPLAVGRRYYAYVTTDVRDLFGNAMNHHNFYFDVSFEGDQEAPQIISTTMQQGDTNVPINTRAAVQFNEAIDTSKLAQIQLVDNEEQVVTTTTSVSDDRRRVVLLPDENLAAGTEYTFEVYGIFDLVGNELGEGLEISFTTGEESDTETGTDIGWSIPVNNTQNVPLNPLLQVTLSEPIDPTTVNESTFYLWDNQTGFNVPGTREISSDRQTLTFVPDELLEPDRRYYLYVGYWPYLNDLAGNLVAQNQYRYFNTGEAAVTSEPMIAIQNFTDGTDAMPINGQFLFEFEQELSDACPLDEVAQLQFEDTFVPVSVSLASDRRTLVITGESALTPDTLYQLTLSGVCDYAGNLLSETSFSFTTTSGESNDTSGPVLVAMTPAYQETDVSILTNIVLEYDEVVDQRAKPPVSGAGVSVPGEYVVAGNTITFTPDDSLLGGTRYTIELYHNVPDLVGNTTWGSTRYFDTQEVEDTTPPNVVAVSPADGSVDFDPNQSVVISFDEPINSGTLNSNNIALYYDGGVLTPSIFRSADGKDVTLTAFLPSSALISVVINDAVTDLAGNALAPFVSTFTTGSSGGDFSRPSIIKRVPENGTSGWQEIHDVYFYTNEAMSPEGLEDALQLSENGQLVEVDVALIGDGRTIKVSKAGGFEQGALVQYFWNRNLTDISGNPLHEYNGYFIMDTNIDDNGIRPYVLAYYPNSSTPEVPLNPVLMTGFSEDIDASTLNAETVTLSDVTAGWVDVPITTSLGTNLNVIEVKPDAPLSPDNQYYLWFSAEIKDTDGDNLTSNHATYFYTYSDSIFDDRSPVISGISPPTGEEGVGTLAYFSVRFDERMNSLSFDHENAINVQFSESDRIVKYNLVSPLPPLAEHTEVAPLVVDLAGNPAASVSTTFITANGPDFINPTVTDTAFFNNQQGVTLNPIFEWDFSEPIDPVSATESGIYIWDSVTGENVPSTFELSPDGKRLTVVPSEELLVLRRYYQYVFYLHDLSGNALGSQSRYVTTGTEPDSQAPTVLNTGVADGDTELPTNLKLNVRFDEPLNPLKVDGIQLTDDQGATVPVNVTLNRGRTLVTIAPKQLLDSFSDFQLNVDGLTDIAGNAQAEPLVLNFSTGATVDMTDGSIVRWSIPVNNTQNVPLNPLLEVEFSERVDKATLDNDSVYLWDDATDVKVPGSWTLNEDGLILRFTPDAPLRDGVRHYFYVGLSPFITDLASNPVAINNSRYFTTSSVIDEDSPIVTQTNMVNGGTALPINGRLVFTLDEEVADTCLMEQGIAITSSAGAHEFTADLATDRRTITVNSATTFDPGTTYTLAINGICDYAGNPITDYSFEFTTLSDAEADTTGPTLVSMSPAHQSTDVSTDLSSIVLVYNEPVDLNSAPPVTGGSITLPGDYSVSGDTITFTPSIPLLGGTRYTIGLYHNVPDLAGNTVWGSTQYFDTVVEMESEPPTVEAISPANGAMDINPAQPIVINFSEPMATSSLTTSNIAIYHNGATISSSLTRSTDGQSVTVNATLPQNGLVSVILNDAITDLSGNALAPHVISFTTGVYDNDTGRPSITQQIPSNGSSGWTELDTIVLYASEALDPGSLSDALTIEEDGVLTTAELSTSGDNRTLTITKDGGFSLGKRTTFYLSGITDTSGNLLFDYSGSIVMSSNVDRIGEHAFVTAYYPNSGSAGTPLNPVLMTSFNEPIDLSSLNSDRVTLQDVTGEWVYMDISWSLNESGTVIEVVPDEELVPDNQYYLWFSHEILDTDGDPLNSSYATYFYTYEDSVVDNMQPTVLAMSPPQDEQDVGVNAQFSIRFDEPMNSLSLDAEANRKTNIQFSEDNRVVTYDHMFPLAPNSEVTEVMDHMRDLAGNQVVASSSTFNTADGPDFVNPSLFDVAYFNNQQDVPTNPVVEWVFSEPIDLVSVTDSGVYIWNDNTNETVPSSWELSADGKRLTLMPDEALEASVRHYAYAFSLRDLSGNPLGNHTRYFTVSNMADTDAPVIESTTLFEGQTNVPTNVKLNIRFNEILSPIPPTSIKLLDSSSDEVAINVSLSRERMLLTVVPKQLLHPNSSYTLTVAGMNDISGNTQATPLVQTFTTGSTFDLNSSGVNTWSIPVNNTQNVPLNPLLEVTFTERVDKATIDEGSFYLWNTVTSTRVPGSWTLSTDGLTLTFEPDDLLQEDTRHYLYVGHSPHLTDLAGNRIAQNNSRYFTTGFAEDTTPLAVSGTSIFDGNTDMPINGRIVMVMDNPISDACLYTDNIQLTANELDVPININLSSNRTVLTITGQSNFEANTSHHLSIVELCDYAGNTLTGSVLSFTTLDSETEDTSGPTLVSISPSNGATDVALTTSIVMQYNEPVDALSAPPVKAGSTVIAGSYNVVGDTITFTPVENLSSSTTYTIELQHNVPDLAGRTVWGSSTTFTTIE